MPKARAKKKRSAASKPLTPAETESLVRAATAARELAYAPYSNFSVGAAVLFADGEVVTGCNVENASYGLTICAERAAIFRGVAMGKKAIRAVCVVAESMDPTAPWVGPCGACRQVIFEFGADAWIVLATAGREGCVVTRIGELLPRAFGPSTLG